MIIISPGPSIICRKDQNSALGQTEHKMWLAKRNSRGGVCANGIKCPGRYILRLNAGGRSIIVLSKRRKMGRGSGIDSRWMNGWIRHAILCLFISVSRYTDCGLLNGKWPTTVNTKIERLRYYVCRKILYLQRTEESGQRWFNDRSTMTKATRGPPTSAMVHRNVHGA